MSDLNFKPTHELERGELVDYIHELQTRVKNADSGARLFRDEANLARTELLRWKEIAGQNEDNAVLCMADVEKHLEIVIRLLRAIPETASAWHEYDLLLRLVVNFTTDMLKNFRETYLGIAPEPIAPEPDDGLPF